MDNVWEQASADFASEYSRAADHLMQVWPAVLEARDGELALVRRDGEIVVPWPEPQAAAALRTLSHLPLRLYLATIAAEPRRLRDQLAELDRVLDGVGLAEETVERNRELIGRVSAAIDERSAAAVGEVVRGLRPIIDANLAEAAEHNLDSLHRALQPLLEALTDDDLRSLVVVNRGNKGARVGNQLHLYLERVLGEDAARHRLVFAEGAGDVEEQRAVLGRYLLDRAIGRVFFDQALTMRSDVLSSPTTEIIQEADTAGRIPHHRPETPEPEPPASETGLSPY